jgi:glycosyltransferase involved in cell wall biosynthesis
MSAERIAIVIPALNEAATIARIVEGVRRYASDVVVVDDGSSDATAAEAEHAGATVVRHTVNQGYDASLNDGFAEAVRRGADIVVSFDADGEHRAEDIPRIVTPITSGAADLVAAQRQHAGSFAEMVFALYTTTVWGIRDPLCGFKAYQRRVYERFGRFDSLRSIGTELMLRAVHAGFRLDSVPIERRVRADVSRFYMRRLRGNLRILRAMGRVIWAVR